MLTNHGQGFCGFWIVAVRDYAHKFVAGTGSIDQFGERGRQAYDAFGWRGELDQRSFVIYCGNGF